MFRRLPVALVHVQASNTSEILSNEIRQIVHSLYQAKYITKRYIIVNEFNKSIIQNGYYIYKF